jgi:hypothetical protein
MKVIGEQVVRFRCATSFSAWPGLRSTQSDRVLFAAKDAVPLAMHLVQTALH